MSSFALHPLYIHLQDIGVEEDGEFKKLQAELNALDEIDYPRVFREKTALMHRAFETYGKKDLASAAYRKFHKENASWLDEYAEFCARRDGDESGYHCWIQFHLDKQFSEEVDYARSKGISFKGDLPIGVSADSADDISTAGAHLPRLTHHIRGTLPPGSINLGQKLPGGSVPLMEPVLICYFTRNLSFSACLS